MTTITNNIKSDMVLFCGQLQDKLDAGWNLRKISQWSFQQRSLYPKAIPYLAILTTENKQVTELLAIPTKTQTALNEFFNEKAPGARFTPKFRLMLFPSKIEFIERTSLKMHTEIF